MADDGNLDKVLTPDVGGDLGARIEQLQKLRFQCGRTPMCPERQSVGVIRGYPHADGIADGDGDKQWAYATCEMCGYQYSLDRLKPKTVR
tara:strand:- start:709 stop:978 length:270 start_codon:yes stop_codon:yes gene_type:complete